MFNNFNQENELFGNEYIDSTYSRQFQPGGMGPMGPGFPGQGPSGFPGQGPSGFPGQGPSGFPGQGPSGVPGQSSTQAPTSPPPSFVPEEPMASTFALESGAVAPCRFRYAYIWPKRGQSFWAWITFVGRRSFAGFRWTGRSWVYFAMDLRDVRSLQCF